MLGTNIVQQDDSAASHLRQPSAEIMTNSFIGMQAIDVQEIDGVICELRESLVEAAAKQVRELAIVAVVILADLVKNLLTIVAGVVVAQPMVDGVTQATEAGLFHRLAKGKVRFSPVRA